MPEPRALESAWTEVEGRRMHARVSRDRTVEIPAIVLVHGIGVSSRYMIPTAEALAPVAAVYAPDLPGFGRSDKPQRTLDVPQLARALAGWMAAERLEDAVVLGNSFGCQTVVELAVRFPHCVSRAVLVGPTVDPKARTVRAQVARWLRNAPHEPPSLALVVARDYVDAGPRRVWRTFRHALRDRIDEKLPQVRAPTLVVRGERDPIVPQRWAEEAARLLPSGRLAVVPGIAHTVNYSAPRELARLVRAFVDER